ncbi:catalase [Sporosarcina sp. ITBMC105]
MRMGNCPFSVTAVEAVDTIEQVADVHVGYRRAHAKGVAYDAMFQPSDAIAKYTTAPHFQTQPVQAIVRFSHSSPSPHSPELLNPIKGMAVRFMLENGGFTNLTMANIPVFVTKTPEAFVQLLQVFAKDTLSFKEKLNALRDSPEFHTIPKLLSSLKPVRSFALESYHSLHAYYLVNTHDEKAAVRFKWEPVQSETAKLSNSTDLETELEQRLEQEQVKFRLMVQFAEGTDLINDPSTPWPEDRKNVAGGVLTLSRRREDGAEDYQFDPTVLPKGMECTDDPVLHFRSQAYEESATRRQRERNLDKMNGNLEM